MCLLCLAVIGDCHFGDFLMHSLLFSCPIRFEQEAENTTETKVEENDRIETKCTGEVKTNSGEPDMVLLNIVGNNGSTKKNDLKCDIRFWKEEKARRSQMYFDPKSMTILSNDGRCCALQSYVDAVAAMRASKTDISTFGIHDT